MKRRLLPIVLLSLFAAAFWTGCNDDEDNLVPWFTRVTSDVDCGPAPLAVQFLATATGGDPQADPTGGNLYLDIRWDFGDGATARGSVTNHVFTEPGVYDVRVTVTDDDGDRAAERLSITVEADSLAVIAAPAETTVTSALAWFDGTGGHVPTPGASNSAGVTADDPVADGPVLNEVMAFNTAIADPDFGEFSPWVEIMNAGAGQVTLTDWTLTDDPAVPDKWVFPSGAGAGIPAGGFLVVWLDGRDSGVDHAGFRLADGYTGDPADFTGALWLYTPEGELQSRIAVRAPAADVSLGRYPDAARGGQVDLRATVRQCGFDPADPDYRLYDFTWEVDDAFGSAVQGRVLSLPWHDDLGERLIAARVYDTQLNVIRRDTVRVTVLPAALAR